MGGRPSDGLISEIDYLHVKHSKGGGGAGWGGGGGPEFGIQ